MKIEETYFALYIFLSYVKFSLLLFELCALNIFFALNIFKGKD